MNSAPRAWILNLDAEHELEAPRGYQPTQHLRAIVARERVRLLDALVAPHDVVLTEDDLATHSPAAAKARGLTGIAWCPTPRALAQLTRAGARPLITPNLDVLRAVNARPFAAEVRAPLARGSFEKHVVTTLDETLARLSLPASDGWLVRRTFGAAGRGRRRIAAGKPSTAERAWIEASLRRGALVVEPWVIVTREYTRSGWVHTNGDVTISAPCFQETTAHGSWSRTERAAAADVQRDDDPRLEEAVSLAGSALARAGYFGPFGIDAYRHRALDGTSGSVLNPLSEINARFTMDWHTAMCADPTSGAARARLDELVERSHLADRALGTT